MWQSYKRRCIWYIKLEKKWNISFIIKPLKWLKAWLYRRQRSIVSRKFANMSKYPEMHFMLISTTTIRYEHSDISILLQENTPQKSHMMIIFLWKRYVKLKMKKLKICFRARMLVVFWNLDRLFDHKHYKSSRQYSINLHYSIMTLIPVLTLYFMYSNLFTVYFYISFAHISWKSKFYEFGTSLLNEMKRWNLTFNTNFYSVQQGLIFLVDSVAFHFGWRKLYFINHILVLNFEDLF